MAKRSPYYTKRGPGHPLRRAMLMNFLRRVCGIPQPQANAGHVPPDRFSWQCCACDLPIQPKQDAVIIPGIVAGRTINQAVYHRACVMLRTRAFGDADWWAGSGLVGDEAAAQPAPWDKGRDPKQGGSSYEASMLRILVADLLQDGGMAVATVGLDMALAMAHTKLAELQAASSTPPLSAAACDALAERRRQIEVEGWTPAHDDEHDCRQLVSAAVAYAMPRQASAFWPWDFAGYKFTTNRRGLVKAAALLLAEIERLDRATAAHQAIEHDRSAEGGTHE